MNDLMRLFFFFFGGDQIYLYTWNNEVQQISKQMTLSLFFVKNQNNTAQPV